MHSPLSGTSRLRELVIVCGIAASCGILASCALRPDGTKEETDRVAAAGAPYERAFEKRELPDIPPEATWRDILRRTFLANGELEASYFEWKASLAQIDVASAYPNSDVQLGYSYMFSSERMKTFDRMTFAAGFDGSKNLMFPTKVQQAGRVALDQTRAAGERFRAKKFDLQKKALFAWADYEARARRIELVNQDIALARVAFESSSAGLASGASQERALTTQLEIQRLTNELADMRAEHDVQRAEINAILLRDPKAPLSPTARPAAPRQVPVDNEALLEASAEVFPEVAAIAEDLRGRKDALELAKMRWIPDINPSFAFTGTISQVIGASIMLPTTIAEIRGSIRAAEAEVQAGEAMLRQRRAERIGEYIGLVVMLRRAQERTKWIESTLHPAAQRLSELRQRGYESGSVSLMEWLEARRMLIEVDSSLAESRAQIEKAIVDIECCLGRDIETITPAAPGAAAVSTMAPTQGIHNHD